MRLQESLELINSFFTDELPLGRKVGKPIRKKLEKERNISFPPEVKEYFDNIISDEFVYINGVGNPIKLLGAKEISWQVVGYNDSPEDGWNKNWFLIANEGGDPIIIDISERKEQSIVYTAMHGAGSWDFTPISNSITQFLICATAMHHALYGFDIDDPIRDDENGFNLVGEPAEWLFPFMKKYANEYYEHWVSVFENHNET